MSLFQDEDGNKMLNEYIREYKIGSGSYAKVVSVSGITLSLSSMSLLFWAPSLFIAGSLPK